MNNTGPSNQTVDGVLPVSVIIPCYNCALTLERAVNSVAIQTCRPAELILVDDASQDDTVIVIKQLQTCYGEGWIKFIGLSTNDGPSVARNRGWDEANQPYIAFLDADDAWHPEKLETQYGWMKEHPEVMLTGHASMVVIASQPVASVSVLHKYSYRQIRSLDLLMSNRFSTPTVMLRRELPLRFNAEKVYAEDYLLWLETVLSGYPVYYLAVPLTYLFKARFGEAGLSKDLWRMERGELDAYRRLHQSGKLSLLRMAFLYSYSLLKFLRRYVMTAFIH